MKNQMIKFGKAVAISFLLAAISAFAQRGPSPQNYTGDPVDTYQDDLSEVHVSLIGARSLDEIIDELQPQFSLASTDALQQAVPDTLNSSQSTLNSTMAQFALIFGMSMPTNPTNATPSNQSLPMNLLTNLPAGTLSVDPLTRYGDAESLYIMVKLLNRSLKDIPHYMGYTPYIVTMQISLIPYRRDAQYDAYSYVAFFTDPNIAPTPPVANNQTIPLIFHSALL